MNKSTNSNNSSFTSRRNALTASGTFFIAIFIIYSLNFWIKKGTRVYTRGGGGRPFSGIRGRGRGGRLNNRRGVGGRQQPQQQQNVPKSKESLDTDLDKYMSKSKSHLDSQLDQYMSQH